MKQSASPATIIVAVIVVALIVGGLWYKFLGPGANPTVPEPPGMQGGTGAPAETQTSSGGGADASIPGMGQGTGAGGGATPSR